LVGVPPRLSALPQKRCGAGSLERCRRHRRGERHRVDLRLCDTDRIRGWLLSPTRLSPGASRSPRSVRRGAGRHSSRSIAEVIAERRSYLPLGVHGVLRCPPGTRGGRGSTLLCVVKDQRRGAGTPVMGHVGTLLLGQCGPARVAVRGRQVDRRTTPAGSVRAILGQSRHRDPVAALSAQVGSCWKISRAT